MSSLTVFVWNLSAFFVYLQFSG